MLREFLPYFFPFVVVDPETAPNNLTDEQKRTLENVCIKLSGLRYKVRTKLMEYKGHIYIPDLAPAV